MDPNATYAEMLAADAAGAYDDARELAIALKEWIGKGGFYPDGHNRLDVFRKLQDIIYRRPGRGPEPMEI